MKDEMFMIRTAALAAYHAICAWWYGIAVRHQTRIDPMGERLLEALRVFTHHNSRWKEVLSHFNSRCDRRPRSA